MKHAFRCAETPFGNIYLQMALNIQKTVPSTVLNQNIWKQWFKIIGYRFVKIYWIVLLYLVWFQYVL